MSILTVIYNFSPELLPIGVPFRGIEEPAAG